MIKVTIEKPVIEELTLDDEGTFPLPSSITVQCTECNVYAICPITEQMKSDPPILKAVERRARYYLQQEQKCTHAFDGFESGAAL